MYADTGDDGIAAYAAGPTPPYATGKITSIAKEGGTWLIWFNGQEAYCCSHGLNGQPKGCPTYSFSHVSRLEPGQYTPGNHYANQVNIWGGLGQLSLDMLDDRPVVASLEDDPAGCEEQPDILGSLYDETQQWIMENYPDSYAAQIYIAAAEELVNGYRGDSPGKTATTPTSITRPQGMRGRLWRWLVRKSRAALRSRMCRVFRNQSTIPLRGQLPPRLPAAALI